MESMAGKLLSTDGNTLTVEFVKSNGGKLVLYMLDGSRRSRPPTPNDQKNSEQPLSFDESNRLKRKAIMIVLLIVSMMEKVDLNFDYRRFLLGCQSAFEVVDEQGLFLTNSYKKRLRKLIEDLFPHYPQVFPAIFRTPYTGDNVLAEIMEFLEIKNPFSTGRESLLIRESLCRRTKDHYERMSITTKGLMLSLYIQDYLKKNCLDKSPSSKLYRHFLEGVDLSLRTVIIVSSIHKVPAKQHVRNIIMKTFAKHAAYPDLLRRFGMPECYVFKEIVEFLEFEESPL